MALRNSHIFSAAHAAALLLPAALLLTGCGSSRRGQKGAGSADYSAAAPAAPSRPAGVQPAPASAGADALIAEARRWLGTPYRYGGAECGEGTDCSGLVMEVYRRVQGVKLPRSSREQMAYCTAVAANRVEPGDLMFFGNPAKTDAPADSATVNHVGLYIGNGLMIHASSSRGVIESSVAQGYWAQRFMGAGRVGTAEWAVLSDGSDGSDQSDAASQPQRKKAAEEASTVASREEAKAASKKSTSKSTGKPRKKLPAASDPSDWSDSSDSSDGPTKPTKPTKKPTPLPLDLLIDQKVDSIAQQAAGKHP